MCDKHNNEPSNTVKNNNCETKAFNDNQQQVKVSQLQQLDNSLKTSIYDSDSPSSSTGTIKKRRHTIASFECNHTKRKTADKRGSTTREIITNNNVAIECQNKSKQSPNHTAGHIRHQSSINSVAANIQQATTSAIQTNISSHFVITPSNMQKSSRSSNNTKEKPQKLHLNKTSDRNANSTSNSPTHSSHHNSNLATASATAQSGTIRKSSHKRSKYSSNGIQHTNSREAGIALYQDENYMEFEFFDREIPNRQMPQFTELFRDFPVSYETTTLALQSSTLPAKPSPVYRDSPPPTPPPLSQLPSRNLRQNENTQSCPSTPFRGKVVLSKKERKELSKLNKLQDTNCSNSTSNIRGFETADSPATSVQSSPYKGRVTELKNCIARINSKGLFASLHRHSQKSLNNQTQHQEEQTTSSSNEISPPPPAPDTSPPGSNASNNNDSDYTEKLKNLPVRQRKAHTSHMDNYCLFDPMDFVNEKALRRRTHESLHVDLPLPQQQQGLRDPLFSSRQNLDFSEEELVPEVIYDEEKQAEDGELEMKVEVQVQVHQRNFDHHNYFVIDPDDFEEEPRHDIGIPNPFTNEQLVQANLIAHTEQHTYANNPEDFKASDSLEKLLNAFDAPSMTNSQESKDTTTTTSTALVESSTSSNSNTSSTSNTSSQTTLQRTKKRLTFLNLSPFRCNKTDKEKASSKATQPKQERAMSELVTSEHMFHLQRMLLSADNVLNDTRPINENIELNYVLFNPGPVPSRNVQYKIRKPRPLSTHSDADSGFLSPCSPDEFSAIKFNPALLVLQQCDSVQGYIEIYTDWANYYLERSKSKKKVTDLSSDCRDGLLLAEVIEAVTSFKVPDLHKKPKNQQQMYDNVNSCLNVLRSQTVSGLDNITTSDICCGRLKAVLALFFALSRFKQQSKQSKCNNATPALSIKAEIHQPPNTTNTGNNTTGLANIGCSSIGGEKINSANSTSTIQNANIVVGNNAQQQQQHVQSIQNGNDTMVNRQIPQAYTKANGTAIPLPATVMVQRRCPPDKVRPLPPTPNHTPSIPGLGKSGSDFNSSRPNSPPSSNHSVQSLKSGNNNGLRPPSVKTGIPAPGTTITPTVNGQQKHSMLDKLKLFNKEKSSSQQTQQQQQTTLNQANKNQMQSKRTSSSSGFSSARSERSDSSLSLNDGHISQIKPPTVSLTSANKNRQEAKGKQTNLLKQQTKKEQVKNSSKLDKKEKSPARSLHKEESGLESRSSTLNRSKNSLTRTGMSSDKSKTSSRTSLNNKSESKTSLIMPPTKTLNSPSGTALPKPIAAVKGTSKLQTATDNKARMSNSNSTQDIIMKREKSDISNAQQQQQHNISNQATTTTINNAQQQPPTHIVKPVPMMAETQHKTPYYANAPQQTMHLMQHHHTQHQTANVQEPTYSRLPPPKTGLSTPSSIRKLEYNSGPGVLQPQHQSPLRNLTTPATHSQPVTPTTQPSNALSNTANNKFHTIPSKIVGTIYEEDKPVNIQPMRPLLRGYNSHVTLPTRGSRGTHHYVADFCENDINQGYCSDGDSLRFSSSRMVHQSPLQGASPRFHDIDNGYLSEGSSGHASHGKHFLSMMRARTQLPTTIEERIRNSRGSLDSIGTAAASSVASQASSSGGSNPKMDMTNGLNGSGNNSVNNSPQHHHSSPSHHRSSSRNSRDNWSKMSEPLNSQKTEHKEKSSPSRRSQSGCSSKQGSPSSSRTKGIPPSFGYVKRSNGCNTATAEQQNIAMMMNNSSGGSSPQNGRTAHVSAVPRTSAGGRKVQGGAQTLPHEMTKMPPNPQHRSYSLTGPGATQLSQCIRERLAGSHSLPKQGSDMHMFQHRLSNRPGKMLDGSLSDTQTYAEVKPEYSSYAMWLKHSNTAGSRLSEGDSLENMQIGSPSLSRHNHKMMQHRAAAAAVVAAANAAAVNTNTMTGSESPYVQSPRLNRSNSIRGPDVEIEPYYCLPVGAQHNGVLSAQMAAAAANAQANNHNQHNNSIAWSQPTSPTPLTRGFSGPMSPTHANTMPGMQTVTQCSTAAHRLTYPKKNDEVHGSTASLLSGGSSLYGTSEERQAQEIRRLKRELMEAREQVLSLSGQLSTNLKKQIEKFKLNKRNNKIKCEYQNTSYQQNPYGADNDSEFDDDDENPYLLTTLNEAVIQRSQNMSATTSTRPSPATTPLYDGYATIRGRGLTRSLSIRAKELEAAQEQENAVECTGDVTVRQYVITTPGDRQRTISLRSDYSKTSPFRSDSNNKMSQSLFQPSSNTNEIETNIYISRSSAKPVKTPTIGDIEPMYASSTNSTFRPLSDASSSSGGANSGSGCRDSVVGSSGSGSINADYFSLKKNSRFSLDSLHSSNTAKTPDYTTADEDHIFLYTAPESPKRRLDSGIRNSYDESSEREYSPLNKQAFEMQEYPIIRTPSEHSQSSQSPAKSRRSSKAALSYKRTQSLGDYSRRPLTLMTSSFQRSDSESPTYLSGAPPSPSHKPPPTPVRRESLYAKPKIYISPSKSPCRSPSLIPLEDNSKTNCPPPQRSSSAEILERSYTSHSLATIDQDEILAVPSAMPMLQNPFDRRYHTLGHMRVQSMGSSLHRTTDSPIGSLVNMMTGAFYIPGSNHSHHLYSNLHPNKSAGNIYSSAEAAVEDLNNLAPEYMDPLDFKIGCQTTLRSKPIIPWYELAIKRDINKRQSCPPISSSLHVNGTQTLTAARSIENQAHVVAAFEQSLSNMTSRLQHLTATAERKDGELTDMRQTIELLRKQSIQAGLTTAHMQSMGVQTQSQIQNDLLSNKPPPLPPSMPGQHMSRVVQHHQQQQSGGSNGQPGAMQRHHSSDSMCSVNSIGSSCSTQDKKQKKKGWLRSSFTKAFSRNAKISKTSRHVGHNHTGSQASDLGSHASSLNRTNGHGDPPGLSALATHPAPPLPASPTKSSPAKTVTLIDNAKPIDAIDHDENIHVVEELKKQLREKDLVLTDIRLEALSSASQLESLKETVNKMRAEMMSLKQNNERLQKLVTSRSLAGSEVSLGNAISPNGSIGESRRYSLADGNSRPPMELPKRLDEEVEEENIPPAPAPEPPPPPISPTTHIDLTPPPPALEAMTSPAHIPTAAEDMQDVSDGKKLAIACYLGQPESFGKYCEEMLEVDDFYANSSMIGSKLDENGERKTFPTASPNEFVIAYTYISGKTSWQNLDYIVRKTFKDYVSRIDPGTNLGLNTDSITSYHLGEAKRGPEMGFPELLPCGYIVGNVRTLYICLQGVGSLAFDSLIPRSIVHRYISLLTEHRRLILCGPSGTGKSYLARRLAEFLVARSGRGNPSEAIATFNVDHKSSKELRQYLGHIAEQAAIANGASELPSVIILDNLHHASALGDVFSCLLSAGPAAKLPCIIGTMSQATCNTTNLQLHHNFRWVLTANHMEPVKGFLGRFLRRRLFQLELQTQHSQPELASVLAWLPTVWQHINRFLEAHSSSDVTIGPRLFLACPLDLKESQVWFTDIWNYHLSPYLIEAVREGVQLYGRRGGAWNDPSAFIRNSYPWPYGPDSVPPLRQINAEDVGLEGVAASNGDNQDPLLNMLMRLQEAANYSENQDQESDCASLDSNITPDSSAGAE